MATQSPEPADNQDMLEGRLDALVDDYQEILGLTLEETIESIRERLLEILQETEAEEGA